MPIPSQRQPVAQALRRLRDSAGYSTYGLAEEIGLSQSRVSRLETGKAIPRPEEIKAWALACGASEDEVEELATLAETTKMASTPWRSSEPGGAVEQQQRVGEREQDAGTNRSFHPTGIYAGLLQTADFIRHQMALTGTPEPEVGITARLNRQGVLYDPGKQFEFVLTKAALLWRPGPRTMQIAQLAHLRQLMTLPNVAIGIIPSDVQAPTFFNEGFTLYENLASGEDPMVEVETVEGERLSTDPAIVATYRRQLELLRSVALFDDQARDLLDRTIEELQSAG